MSERGANRGLTAADFGPGGITMFKPAQLGPNWQKVHALAAFRLDAFLRKIRVPFQITSTFRSAEANEAADGAATSRHLPDARGLSNAFDLWLTDPAFFTRARVHGIMAAARAEGFNGVGFYAGKPLVHVDVRPAPWSWLKLASGKFAPRDRIADILAGPAPAIALGGALLLILAVLMGRRRSGGA